MHDDQQAQTSPGSTAVRFAGHEGITIAGDAWGNPQHPPVILLPGGGQTRHAWGATAQRLATDGWYALSLDLRGHGESEWHPEADYTMDAFVGDLLSIAKLQTHPPALVGASLGGITSLLAAGEVAPFAFKAIVLVDIAPRMEAEGVQRIVAFMRAHLDGFATLEEAADAITEYMPQRKRPKDLSGLNKNLRRDPDGRYRWHWDPDFVLGGRGPDASRQPDRLLKAARGLKIPALLIRGQMSEVISEEGAREFLVAAPHADYVDVSDAGHMVAGDRNDVFAQAVIDFLRRVR
ncbi:MAG TPA: alpha/beta hydrolase [Candidatus Acidoferrales bacterium]|nr:alpha/beta hydrolase [Candidatus Acidoferrales bacterium]